ncbi:MAG: outer membrane protein assembly factor BamC [Deltaproteobacteria bacterium]|nr:outer membrane protein assembly factor BamC [Deltaproteobacteria bacterium]
MRHMVFGLLMISFLGGCNKAILYSHDKAMPPVSRAFNAGVSDAFKAAEEVVKNAGYKIEREDEKQGSLTTGWLSTKVDSHYIDLFDKRDYGTIGAYYRLEIHVTNQDGKALVEVSAPTRSVISGRLKSSHTAEEKVLGKIADLLRREDFEMTNVGVTE